MCMHLCKSDILVHVYQCICGCKFHRDCCQQSFRYIGNDNANEKDDSLKPCVAKNDREDKEGDPKKDSYSSNDVDEVLNFQIDGGLAHFQPRSQGCNSPHNCTISGCDHNATGCTYTHTNTYS